MAQQIVQDEVFMQFFWDLASEQDETRRIAAKSLVEYAESHDSQYVEYALNRLFRGLSSPRDSARLGFSVALSGMLQKMSISVEKAAKMLDEHTQVRNDLFSFDVFLVFLAGD